MTGLPQRREQVILLGGGLDLDTSPLRMDPGTLLACLNYEGLPSSGYTRIEGYERFDGQDAPHTGYNIDPFEDTSDALRALITEVPGTGPVRGVHLFNGNVYAFRDNEDEEPGDIAKMWVATGAGWSEVDLGAVTLNPAGRYSFVNYAFESGAGSEVMLGVSGTNKAFVFDGTTYTEIDVEGETAFPQFIAVVNNYTFLAFESGAVYWSGVGDPEEFTIVGGAGAIGIGAAPVGLHAMKGGTLMIRTRTRLMLLYGNGPTDWAARDLRTNEDSIGGEAYSAVNYGAWYFLDERGVMELSATDQYGDFASNMVSRKVTRYLAAKTRQVKGAVISKTKRQIRWLFSADGAERTDVLTLSFSDRPEAFTTQVYPFGTYCATHGDYGAQGSQVDAMFIGANNGFVYRVDQGESFDGADIESYLRLPYWSLKSPNQRKHIKRVLFNVSALGEAELRVRPYFNYAGPEPANHAGRDMPVSGSSSIWDAPYWDEVNWNEFNWAGAVVQDGRADITGTGKNFSITLYHKGVCAPFTIFEAIVQYTLRSAYR